MAQWWNISPPGRDQKCFRLLRKVGNRLVHVMWFDMHPGMEQRLIEHLVESDQFNKNPNLHNMKFSMDLAKRLKQKSADREESNAGRVAKNMASDFADDVAKEKFGRLYSYRK